MNEPKAPLRYCERDDKFKVNHVEIDAVILHEMENIKHWVSRTNTERFFWSTCQAKAMKSIYNIVSIIEISGEHAQQVASWFKSRLEYGIGSRNQGFSMRQVEIMIGADEEEDFQ